MDEQLITPAIETQTASPEEAVSIEVNYDTNPSGLGSTGLGLRLHWDSTQLTFNDIPLESAFPDDLFPIGIPEEDADDLDNDSNTDNFVVIAWAAITGTWPNDPSTLPVSLLTANFTTTADFSGTTVNFSNSSPAQGFTFNPTSAVINLEDTPTLPTLTIDDVTVTEGDSDTTPATFTVTLSEAADTTVTVDYTTAPDTASASENDYVETSGTLTFEPGVTNQTFTVDVNGDTEVEPDETFFVNLSNVSDNVTLADMQGIGTISNDDEPTVTNSQIVTPVPDTQTVVAGDDFSIDVNYSTDPANTPTTGLGLQIFWDSSEVLFAGASNLLADNAQPMGEITEDVDDLDGDSSTDRFFIQAWVSINGEFPNATPSDSERLFTANFTAADSFSGTTINFNSSNTATGFEFASTSATIEAGTVVLPELSISDVSVTEGNEGDTTEAIFTVTLSEAADSDVTVEVSTQEDTASAADGDYIPLSETLTFAPGETSQTITVEVIGDTEVEPDETFFVNLENVSDNAEIDDGQGVGTILNDDEPPVPVELSIDDVSVTEGDDGETTEAVFEVTLSEAADSEVTVEFSTQADTASAADGDYTGISGTLTFEVGQTSQTIVVEVNGDTEVEPDETFFVNLENASDNAVIADGQGIGTILNDDEEAPVVELSIDDVTVTEGDSGVTEAVFEVTLSEAADSEVTVEFSTQADTASAADGDYTGISGTLTFEAGETSQTIVVEVIGDTEVEPDETFFVNLENASDNAVIADEQGIGTILNDDAIERNLIEGTPGNDNLSGTDGDDLIRGLSGDDLLIGGLGSDLLEGLEGMDTLNGSAGMDIVIGGPGRDLLIGGSEGDLFVLPTSEASNTIQQSDRILAFQVNFFNPNQPIDRIGLTDGLTEDDLFLQGAGENTIVRIADSNDILGIVVGVTPARVSGTFVSIDDVALL